LIFIVIILTSLLIGYFIGNYYKKKQLFYKNTPIIPMIPNPIFLNINETKTQVEPDNESINNKNYIENSNYAILNSSHDIYKESQCDTIGYELPIPYDGYYNESNNTYNDTDKDLYSNTYNDTYKD